MELRSRSSLLFLSILLILISSMQALAEVPADVQPNAGAVDGSQYTSKFFGFTYSMPEQWALRSIGTRVPGNGTYMLLSLRPKSATGGLSTIMVTAAKLTTENDDALWHYLLERYRLNQNADSNTTINGIPTSRIKRSAAPPEPALLSFSEHTFYRLRLDGPATTRIAIATIDKGYALIFEAIVPQTFAEQTENELISSLHTLNFGSPASVRIEDRGETKRP